MPSQNTHEKMQAILTTYLAATNTRESRIKATCDRGSITIPYPHELGQGEPAHSAAAQALVEKFAKEDVAKYGSECEKNPWLWPRVCGGLPGEKGYAHVFTGEKI